MTRRETVLAMVILIADIFTLCYAANHSGWAYEGLFAVSLLVGTGAGMATVVGMTCGAERRNSKGTDGKR